MKRVREGLHSVLFVCTSCTQSSWGTATGLWLNELATPYYVFKDAGYEVEICTILGGAPAIDPGSYNDETTEENRQRFLNDEEVHNQISSALSVKEIISSDIAYKYGCLFLCGGHGCYGDFVNNKDLTTLIDMVYIETKGCLAAVCHGPIALLGCKHNDKYLLKDKFCAAFSNEEEAILGLEKVLPFLLESEMDDVGAVCVPRLPWQPNAVVDGRLVTGQNPQSSLEVALRALDVLRSLGARFSPPENENKPWGT